LIQRLILAASGNLIQQDSVRFDAQLQKSFRINFLKVKFKRHWHRLSLMVIIETRLKYRFMNFDKLVEEKLREAIAQGEFDNLAGKGKPVDLTAYFATPEDLRLGYSILKNAGVVPQEMQLLKEVETLKEKLESTTEKTAREKLQREIDEQTLKFNLLVELYKRRLSAK
jgi:hypothetical protein